MAQIPLSGRPTIEYQGHPPRANLILRRVTAVVKQERGKPHELAKMRISYRPPKEQVNFCKQHEYLKSELAEILKMDSHAYRYGGLNCNTAEFLPIKSKEYV